MKAGHLTQAQANDMLTELKSHLTDSVNGTMPAGPVGPAGPGPFFGHHHGPGLDAAAKYLGITEEQLRTELQNGKTPAAVAKAHGKTVDGLVNALVADAQTKLDAAVKSGRLTQDQADQMLSDLKEHVTDLVNGKAPARPFGDHGGDHPGFRGGGFRGGALFGPPPAGRPA